MQRSHRTCLTLIALLSSVAATADVAGYYTNFYEVQVQDSDLPPSLPSQYSVGTFLITQNVGEATAMTLLDPFGVDLPAVYDTGTILVHYSPIYSDVPTMQAGYPAGSYTFNITAGTLAPASGSLPVDPINFPSRIPYLDSGTYSALQNAPSNTAQPVSFGTFSLTGASALQSIGFGAIDMTTTLTAFSDGGDQTLTNSVIPDTAMLSGHRYFYYITFNAYNQYPNQGFGTATGSCSNISQTTGYFNVLADPGTVAGKITLGDNPYVTGKSIEVIVREAGTSNILDTQTVVPGYEGYYAFEPNATGLVDIYYKGPTWLTKKMASVDLSVGQDNMDPTLLNGDCNGDDVVDLTDYTTVAIAFNSLAGDPSFDPTADLDGNAVIDLTDYTIIALNFNALGDTP